jgi:hypothetical protein
MAKGLRVFLFEWRTLYPFVAKIFPIVLYSSIWKNFMVKWKYKYYINETVLLNWDFRPYIECNGLYEEENQLDLIKKFF